MSSYADLADVKATIAITAGDTFLDNDLERAISAASSALDAELGRSFGLSEDANDVRLYSPGLFYRSGELEIDDLDTLTRLRVDPLGDGTWATWTLGTDFRLEPLNAPVKAEPWTIVRLIPTTLQTIPTNPLGVIEVTGRFGWADVPAQIVEASGLLAEQLLIRKRQAPLGFVTAGADVGAVAYLARHDPQVAALIAGFYRRKRATSLGLT